MITASSRKSSRYRNYHNISIRNRGRCRIPNIMHDKNNIRSSNTMSMNKSIRRSNASRSSIRSSRR